MLTGADEGDELTQFRLEHGLGRNIAGMSDHLEEAKRLAVLGVVVYAFCPKGMRNPMPKPAGLAASVGKQRAAHQYVRRHRPTEPRPHGARTCSSPRSSSSRGQGETGGARGIKTTRRRENALISSMQRVRSLDVEGKLRHFL